MGLVKMRKSQRQLTYMEGKPTVYQLKQLIYAPIKEKDLIKYISQSANVPETPSRQPSSASPTASSTMPSTVIR